MLCPSCGAQVSEQEYCENCGKPLAGNMPMVDPKTTVDLIFASVGLPTSAQVGASLDASASQGEVSSSSSTGPIGIKTPAGVQSPGSSQLPVGVQVPVYASTSMVAPPPESSPSDVATPDQVVQSTPVASVAQVPVFAGSPEPGAPAMPAVAQAATPAQSAMPENVSVEKALAEKAPVEKAPAEKAPVKKAPVDNAAAAAGASASGPDGLDDFFSGGSKEFQKPQRSQGRTVAIVVAAVVAVLAVIVALFMGLTNSQVSGADSSATASGGAEQNANASSPSTSSADVVVPSEASSESGAASSDASSSQASSATSESSATSSSASSSSSTGGSSADSSSTSASSASSAAADARCFDAKGNASLYLVCELTGKEMKKVLERNDYSWVAGASAWITRDGSIVEVQDADGALPAKKITKLKKGGSGTPCVYVIMTNGYATPSEALSGLSKGITVNDTIAYDDDDEISFARVSGSSGEELLVAVTKTADNQQTLLIFNNKAIEQGLFASVVGVAAGKTIDEIWAVLDK